jgi:hypothetical protein
MIMGLPGLTRDEKKEMFVIALVANRGNVTKACDQIMISRQTYHNWIERDEDFADRVKACADDIRQTIADAMEDVIVDSAVNKGWTQDARWWLSKKAKDRGYGDKMDITVQDLGHFKGLKYPDETENLEDFEKMANTELKLDSKPPV